MIYHVIIDMYLFIIQRKKKKDQIKKRKENQNKILESKHTITYIDYVLEVYKVDSSILETLLSSLILTNTRLLFCFYTILRY